MEKYNEIWEIYIESFPENQRRNLENQKKVLKNPLYKFEQICFEGKLVGFIGIWDLPNFVFLEHFAVKREFRGQGYGTNILKKIIQKCSKKIILEVEKPDTIKAKKRIDFYEKFGFNLNEYDYYQPAYNENTKPEELYIMSYPSKIDKEEFTKVRKDLYLTVYGCSI
ncbi:GNAT family N-acetyltransferase [Clostridium sediminicola]|uniref:GNAT family N-acetyltransferase n=1 Tax=Clostridium sediminicola TaxID=3114879 RepID=UPI0031F1C93F